ncbi:MAG: hypothetical protein HC822_05260 [Oscillochloris sp.]|nr:hypothetical protein [Oscillochloris sp.]
MRARAKRRPGQPGTKALVELYGDRLVCVRYRYDAEKRRRYKTVELIIDEGPWNPAPPPLAPDTIVYLRVGWGEYDLVKTIKLAGGTWREDIKYWSLRYDRVVRHGLLDRMVVPSSE